MAVKKVTKEEGFQIPAPKIQTIRLTLNGITALIYHKWSEKAKKMMRDKQAKKPSGGREVRDPEAEYRESFYFDNEGYLAFPALAIKQALVAAARNIEGITMAELKGSVFVIGDSDGMVRVLVKEKPVKLAKTTLYGDDERVGDIFGVDEKTPQIQMREDMVRVGMGSADLRYRGQVKDWSITLLVRFNANKLSAEQVLNLVQYAGFSSGIGEWRPERNGESGTFEIGSTSKAV